MCNYEHSITTFNSFCISFNWFACTLENLIDNFFDFYFRDRPRKRADFLLLLCNFDFAYRFLCCLFHDFLDFLDGIATFK